jgi:Homeobox KN domain
MAAAPTTIRSSDVPSGPEPSVRLPSINEILPHELRNWSPHNAVAHQRTWQEGARGPDSRLPHTPTSYAPQPSPCDGSRFSGSEAGTSPFGPAPSIARSLSPGEAASVGRVSPGISSAQSYDGRSFPSHSASSQAAYRPPPGPSPPQQSYSMPYSGPPYAVSAPPHGCGTPSPVAGGSGGAGTGMTPAAYPNPTAVHFETVADYGDNKKQGRRRGNLPKQVTDILRMWFQDHVAHPYPTEEEKQQLMHQTGLTISQVSPHPSVPFA